MNLDLSGKTALVAGASRGIGRGVVLGLAAAGAAVWLLGRGSAELEQLASEIRQAGGQAHALVADVTDGAQLEAAFASVSRLDVLVVNAGTNIPEPFMQVTEAHYDRIMDLNVKAAFFTAQRGVARMEPGGAVVFITSQMGHVGAADRTVYCASKHALEGLAKALAVELAPRGIRVNCVAPTFVETDLTRPMLADPQFQATVLSKIPLGRMGRVEEVAAAVVFLCSSQASLITGTSLLTDGGWTAQ
jgi:NAD(P)-dependent dehydrogenase (short-subunit alcohol dehydrogenase family)